MTSGIQLPVNAARCARRNAAVRVSRVTAICLALAISPSIAATATLTYGYDLAGRLISVSSAGQGATTYAYDPAGNLLQRSFSAEADADHDGLVTAQEIALGLDPANSDSDHDGVDDGAEVAAGTNGLNPASLFTITSAAVVAGGAVEINVPTVTGRYYTLQSSTALTGWMDEDETASVAVPGTGLLVVLRDVNAAAGRKFYRVLVSQ